MQVKNITKITSLLSLRKYVFVCAFTKKTLLLAELLFNENLLDSFYLDSFSKRLSMRFKTAHGRAKVSFISNVNKKGQKKKVTFKGAWVGFHNSFGQLYYATDVGFVSESSVFKMKRGGFPQFFISLKC